MARTGDLEHPDCLSCLLRNRDISFDNCAETIAFTTYQWGHDAARSIFEAWRGSSGHWGILMSRKLTANRHRRRVPEHERRRHSGPPSSPASEAPASTRRRLGRGAPPGPYPEPVARHPFAAVNLISDPIHGYLELTKRLSRAESAEAGLPDEDAAEDDLLDTAWLQRLRRISQLQSARWVFPTAEHSRFTHGLGVMHEAGPVGARAAAFPSGRAARARAGRVAPVRGPGRRDAARRGPPP